MTTRPEGLVDRDLRYRRGKRVAFLAHITRTDGETVCLTSHDRTLTFDGEEYRPLVLAGLSADRREAALRSGDQEAQGIVDGDVITVPDLYGNRWRGAMVRQIVIDWERPWCVIARHRKWIRSLTWRRSGWVGTLETRAQVLQRPTGGTRGGAWATTCVHQLGEPNTCRADVSIGSGFAGAGAKVDTIVTQRKQVQFEVASWPGTFEDDYFRDGSFTWMWSAPTVTGTITSTTGDNSLSDNTKTWVENEHVGKWVRVLTAAGEGVDGAAYAEIVANTTNGTVYYDTTAAMAGFTAGTDYDICDECPNFGEVSPIIAYAEATRGCTFLLPTQFPIAVGDSGVWVAGCNGLRATCESKFDNVVNFGGDPFAPSAQQIIEPPEAT